MVSLGGLFLFMALDKKRLGFRLLSRFDWINLAVADAEQALIVFNPLAGNNLDCPCIEVQRIQEVVGGHR